jgi:hypothetical protein
MGALPVEINWEIQEASCCFLPFKYAVIASVASSSG